MNERVDRITGENLYQPKIHSQSRGIPISLLTTLVALTRITYSSRSDIDNKLPYLYIQLGFIVMISSPYDYRHRPSLREHRYDQIGNSNTPLNSPQGLFWRQIFPFL